MKPIALRSPCLSVGRSVRPTSLPVLLALSIGAACSSALAQGPGEVLWRTRLDGPTTPTQFITRGPDGAIYTSNRGALYALNPDGTVRWARTDVAVGDGVAHSISLGADGTIYSGMGIVGNEYALVVALNPDGSTKWTYIPPEPAILQTGPNVGPDGNIYATDEDWATVDFRAFSLDPTGNLRWVTVGDPAFLNVQTPITTSDIEFGADRLHTGVVPVRSGGTEVIYTFDLSGPQLWTTWDLDPSSRNFPAVDPFNRVIVSWGQTGLRALSPDGQQEWFRLHPNGASVTLRPAIDSNGIIYSGDAYGVELWALNPDGSTRYVRPPEGLDSIFNLAITPDDRVILGRGASGIEPVTWLRGYDAQTGQRLWQLDLLPENDLFQFVSSYEPAFSPDGSIAYVTTQFAGSANPYGYVYAIQTQGLGEQCRPDLTSSAVAAQPGYGVPNSIVNNDDFFYYLTQFAAGNLAVADMTASAIPGSPGYGAPNGVLNNDDFFFYLNLFSAGC